MRLFPRIVGKLHHMRFEKRRQALEALVAEQLPFYSNFCGFLRQGNAVGVSGYPWRAVDQLRVLERVRPLRIVEIGSGTSTGIFAHYVSRQPEASLLSLDESEQWAELTRRGLEQVTLFPHEGIELQAAQRIENEWGSFLDRPLEGDIDLLYIDGPSLMKKSGMKTANQDITQHFDKGGRPGAIMIDGRIDTVRSIITHSAFKDYRYEPSTKSLFLAPARGINPLRYASVGLYHRHAVFYLKTSRKDH